VGRAERHLPGLGKDPVRRERGLAVFKRHAGIEWHLRGERRIGHDFFQQAVRLRRLRPHAGRWMGVSGTAKGAEDRTGAAEVFAVAVVVAVLVCAAHGNLARKNGSASCACIKKARCR
jgi:hypothetical protein